MDADYGIALLFSDKQSDTIRELQLSLAEYTNDYSAFLQPPHVTLKRPFRCDHQTAVSAFNNIATTSNLPKNVHAEKIIRLGDQVLAIRISDNIALQTSHMRIITSLAQDFGIAINNFEGEDVLFHISLQVKQTKQQISQEHLEYAQGLFRPTKIKVTKLALLIKPPELSNWSIMQSIAVS